MVDFRSGYVPPGVYVTADTSTVTAAVGATPTVVCLVGQGLGYQTYTDHIVFANATDSQVLTQDGINKSSVVVTSTSGGVTTTYNVTDDYTLDPPDTSDPSQPTTIAIVSTGNINPGDTIDISYQYTDSDYYSLNQFTEFTTFTQIYGQPFGSTDGGKTVSITSPLSFAASVAFANGANIVYAIALSNLGSVSEQFKQAYDLSKNNYDINLLVPIWPEGDDVGLPNTVETASTYINDLRTHLADADSDGYPRNAVVGLPASFDSSATPDEVAVQFGYRRVVLVYPNRLNYYNNGGGTVPSTVIVGGQYLAAGAAGVLANNITAQGLTRQRVVGFTGIASDIVTLQTTVNKNTWSSRGVAVLELNRAGQLVFRHGVTTDPSSVTTREFSIVRCQDELFNEVQQTLESSQLIGTPITTTTPLAVKSLVAGALEVALGNNTIQGYDNLSVRQLALPSGDPTMIECVFSYKPTYPLNYITVSFSFDLSTGDITTSTDTAGDTSNG